MSTRCIECGGPYPCVNGGCPAFDPDLWPTEPCTVCAGEGTVPLVDDDDNVVGATAYRVCDGTGVLLVEFPEDQGEAP